MISLSAMSILRGSEPAMWDIKEATLPLLVHPASFPRLLPVGVPGRLKEWSKCKARSPPLNSQLTDKQN